MSPRKKCSAVVPSNGTNTRVLESGMRKTSPCVPNVVTWMGPKADMKIFVGASPTPRCSRAGRSAAGKLLPRKCPERSLVPTKMIGSRCMNPRLPSPPRPVARNRRDAREIACTENVRTQTDCAPKRRSAPHDEVSLAALPTDRFAVLSEIRSRTVVPVGVRPRARLGHEHDGLHAADFLSVHGFHRMA